jgi:Leucine-rich repeat (LRR) protein
LANQTAKATQTNLLSQCVCGGTIRSISTEVTQRYHVFQGALASTLGQANGLNETISSCAPSNVALLFLAEDVVGTSTNATTRSIDQRYLLALHYLLMNGRDWENATGWFSSLPECEWEGITCDSDDNVLTLQLSGNNLNGSIPSWIGLLSTLQVLDLSVNGTSILISLLVRI